MIRIVVSLPEESGFPPEFIACRRIEGPILGARLAIFRQTIGYRRIATRIFRTNPMVGTARLIGNRLIVVVVQPRRLKTHRRRSRAQFCAPALLQWLGIALICVFLFWAMAMVFMQAWQTLRSRGN
jgi:hypothetical protein